MHFSRIISYEPLFLLLKITFYGLIVLTLQSDEYAIANAGF